ncbi:MAG: protein kinase domain-containing protein [Chitinivibrionales bacterium]
MTTNKESTEHKKQSFTSKNFERGEVKIGKILENIERTILPIGTQIGKYRIIEEIDRGGMAVVYKALQLDLNRVVALKVLPANVTINRQFVERFLSEAHAVARLNHPNIVSIHEVSMENNIYYLAMDYIDGKNLYYYLNEYKPKLVEVLEIVVQLADALSFAHEQRIIHRDLKLNNVIMDKSKRPLLIDFGLAKALEDDDGVNTRTGEIMGSPAYMAPERLMGREADLRSDVCSLGIMLYEMLTFKNPYLDPRSIHQTTLNVMESHPVPPRKLMPWLPIEVECITLKAMSHDPDERYQTMAELKDDIVRYQRGEQVSVRPPSIISKLKYQLRRRWAPIAIGATVVFFLAVLGVLHLMQTRKEQWHWRLIQNHSFENRPEIADWEILNKERLSLQQSWNIINGALKVKGNKPTSIRLQRPFTRDLRFEFEVVSPTRNFYGFGFFMCGDTPENGYTFRIHSGPDALSGITYPGSDFIHFSYDPLLFPATYRYHVVVEKIDHTFTFKLNGTVIAQITDQMLRQGKNHQRVGFFSEGGVYEIDNFKVFRRSVPMLASPTIVADRFWEHGDYESAFNEYKELLLDFSHQDIVRKISINMADCLVRMGRQLEADSILHTPILRMGKEDDIHIRALFLEALNYHSWGMEQLSDSVYLLLRKRYAANPVNTYIAVQRLERADTLRGLGKYGAAEKIIIETARDYPWLQSLCGRYQVRILQDLIDRRRVEKALVFAERMLMQYSTNDQILAEVKIILGKLYLGNRTKYKGIEYLNQSINAVQMSPVNWKGWWTLAEVYEYDHKPDDARSIYEKIWRESSKNLPLTWMAGIKCAQLQGRDEGLVRDSLLDQVMYGDHPFALPRLVASLYSGKIDKYQFSEQWQNLYPGDSTYLFYWARDDIGHGRDLSAEKTLKELLSKVPPNSWEHQKASMLLRAMSTPAFRQLFRDTFSLSKSGLDHK